MGDPDTERPLLAEDLTHCHWHPDRLSVGWHDVRDEAGAVVGTVGGCAECIDAFGQAHCSVTLSPGKPCLCGPGFCAYSKGIGCSGFCAGSRPEPAPDCTNCGAPHQSAAGCWLCGGRAREEWERENDEAWLLALQLGVDGLDAFRLQDEALKRGEAITFREAVERAARVPRG